MLFTHQKFSFCIKTLIIIVVYELDPIDRGLGSVRLAVFKLNMLIKSNASIGFIASQKNAVTELYHKANKCRHLLFFSDSR